jgi:hypothetical protein
MRKVTRACKAKSLYALEAIIVFDYHCGKSSPDAELVVEGVFGIASFIASSFLALVNTFDLSTNSFSIASFPSRSNPLGTLPSAHIPFSYTTLSFSSLRVLNIFIILLIAFTFFLKRSFSIDKNI